MRLASTFSGSTRQQWLPPSIEELQALLPSYQFLALIGRGGMGAVYKATQLSLNRPVAIKILPADLLHDTQSGFAARFRQEALTMAKLSHPGIVSVLDSGQVGTLLYIAMEFVDGTDLGRIIQAEGRLTPEAAADSLAQVCEALEYAHRYGVVHRDIKPANLLVTKEGRIKIVDFGLAKQSGETTSALTQTNVAMGTPDFLAPEAWTPGTSLDSRADLYSVGVTLYQMLTGEVPRGLWKMPSVKVGVDSRFDQIIDRAMQPDREARYQSSAELRKDLQHIHARPAAVARADEAESVRRPPARGRRLAFVLAMTLVLIGAVLLLLWPRDNQPPTVREAARWLVQEGATFRVLSKGTERPVSSLQDIPTGDFQIVYLWFDRWQDGVPHRPPAEKEFEVLSAVKSLQFAFLRMPGLSEAAFGFLRHNTELDTLFLEGADTITDEVLTSLAGLRRLRKLTIADARTFTGRKLVGAPWLGRLEHLDLLKARIDDSTIQTLTNCLRLNHLRVQGTAITREGLRTLSSLPRLTELLAGGCARITEENLIEALPAFHRLKRLELEYSPYGDNAASVIASTLTNLTALRLANTQITDAGLARIATLPRLTSLRVARTKVTPEGLAAFRRARPGCRLDE